MNVIIMERVDRNDQGEIISTSAINCWDFNPENFQRLKEVCVANNSSKKTKWRLVQYERKGLLFE